MYNDILIPADGSEGAQRAIDHGLDLATRYGATVHGLYVIEPIYSAYAASEQLTDASRADGQRAVNEFTERVETKGFTPITEIRTGTPHQEILDYAEDNDIDLIVMGTHGRTGLDRYLLGSVT